MTVQAPPAKGSDPGNALNKAPAWAVRPAEEKDLDAILLLYEGARRFMRESGNPCQWGNVWPPEDLIREDIRLGRSFVLADASGSIYAVFVYLYGENAEPEYSRLEGGSWQKDGPYGVVHRIAAAENGRGAGSFCLRWAFEKSGALRIDTHPDNAVMQRTLKKLGFEKRGTIRIEDDHVEGDLLIRYAYEKL